MSSEIQAIALVPEVASVSFNWDVKPEPCRADSGTAAEGDCAV